MTIAQLDLVRRCCRMGFAGLGVLFTLVFVRFTERARHPIVVRALFDDEVVFGLTLVLSLGLVAGLARYAWVRLRSPRPPRPSFWRTGKALLGSLGLYGLGSGLCTAWIMEWDGDEEGAVAFFVLGGIAVAVTSALERGRLPALGLLTGVVLGGSAAMGRIVIGGVREHYLDEIVIFFIFGLFLFPIGYLLLRGLLNLVGGQTAQRGGGHGFGLPLQVVAKDETYLVTVETPGLDDAQAVAATVVGAELHLLVPRPMAKEGTLLYSTRPSGRFPIVVVLPQPLQDPWNVTVAHGLLTVQVAPIGD
jgi:HSP20 family molecular chaperone IbpA